jgi:protein-L-isoaspartate(D-aspartate) O-methyltransferase
MNILVSDLIGEGYLKTDSIIQAFLKIKRECFVLDDLKDKADLDIALPIDFGQTISQPATVAIMLELLAPAKGNNILDVGSGSAWTTALLCWIAGPQGKVTALEIIKKLMEWGRSNFNKCCGLKNKKLCQVEFHSLDGKNGFPQNAPYDCILVSAAADFIPETLKKQLKIGGKMVIPIKNSLVCLEKIGRNKFREKEYPGFAFVPLV